MSETNGPNLQQGGSELTDPDIATPQQIIDEWRRQVQEQGKNPDVEFKRLYRNAQK
jgi:hypothetical protein